jgi:hypothetical protein
MSRLTRRLALLGVVVIGSIVAAVWYLQDSTFVRGILDDRQRWSPLSISFEVDAHFPSNPPRTGAAGTKTSGAMLKCVEGSRILYTNDACPAGSTEQSLDGGTLTVAPAVRPSVIPSASALAASLRTARDLAAPSGEDKLMDKRMEQIIGK